MKLQYKILGDGLQTILSGLWVGIFSSMFGFVFISFKYKQAWMTAQETFKKDRIGLSLWYELITDVMPRLCVVLVMALALVVLFRWFRVMLIKQQEIIENVREKWGMVSWRKTPAAFTENWKKNIFLGFVFGLFSAVGTQAGEVINQVNWKPQTHSFIEFIRFSDQERRDLKVRSDNAKTEGNSYDADFYNNCYEDDAFRIENQKCKVTDYASVGFRDTWSIVAGIVGGPVIGLISGIIGGGYREAMFGGSLGGISFIATACIGFFTGIIRQIWPKLIKTTLSSTFIGSQCNSSPEKYSFFV